MSLFLLPRLITTVIELLSVVLSMMIRSAQLPKIWRFPFLILFLILLILLIPFLLIPFLLIPFLLILLILLNLLIRIFFLPRRIVMKIVMETATVRMYLSNQI